MGILIDMLIKTWYLWAFLFVLSVLVALKPRIKGIIGEKSVAVLLHSLPAAEYKVLHDCILPTATGTTQIDHIVVSPYGIFVIETKNYKGWIYGTEHSAKWTQNIYGKKNTFMNPIHQNYAHVKAIEAQLSGMTSIPIVPIVAFSGEADLKVDTKSAVVYFSRLTKTILQYKEKKGDLSEVDRVCDQLSHAKIRSKGIKREHIAGVKNKVALEKNTVASGHCPRCGAALILKNGKYGSFTGCSNYPKCRYIQK